MKDFVILLPDGGEVEIFQSIPEQYKPWKVKSACGLMAKVPLGAMLFNHVTGDGFDVWVSHYLMKKEGRVIGQLNRPVLELQIALSNVFQSLWDKFGLIQMKEGQYELTYTPFVNNETSFHSGKPYSSFDIHFQPSFLQPYAAHADELKLFLDKVALGKPAQLLDTPQFLNARMIALVNEMLHFDYTDAMAGRFFESCVHLLLMELVHRLPGVRRKAEQFTRRELEAGEAVHLRIVSDFSRFETVKELARFVGLSPYKLQTIFQHLYGTTIFKFSQRARLEHAKRLLLENDWTLPHIAWAVGYPDDSNFAAAFKREMGLTPGQVRRK